MSRLSTLFAERRAAARRALVTYLVAGDPVPEATVDAMHALVRGGADVIELGMPFSDPEAEGPDIQRGHERALGHGVRLVDVLAMVERFRASDDGTGVVLMGYLNAVERMGYERFARAAAAAGVDGLILVNLPYEEAPPLREALVANGIDLIFLVAPTTTEARARHILEHASGFVYYVSLKGTTGAGTLDVDEVRSGLGRLRPLTALPLAVGFGIRDGAAAGAVARLDDADAVVVGSAVVRIMGEGADAPDALPARLEAFAAELRGAMDAVA